MLWEFQRDGLLPYERNSVPDAQRTPVEEEMLIDMEPSLAGPVPVSLDVVKDEVTIDEAGWEHMPVPMDEAVDNEVKTSPDAVASLPVIPSIDQSDERAQLEAELARLDASWNHRQEPAAEQAVDPALAALEARLSGIDF
jgi:hypothetical protein